MKQVCILPAHKMKFLIKKRNRALGQYSLQYNKLPLVQNTMLEEITIDVLDTTDKHLLQDEKQ